MDSRLEIAARALHRARCHACGGAPSYSDEHRRPPTDLDRERAAALLAELGREQGR